MHKDWCGKSCGECLKPCSTDIHNYCSPDCPELGTNGEHLSPVCQECDCLPEYGVSLDLSAVIQVKAEDADEARKIAIRMGREELYKHLSEYGKLDIGKFVL